MTVPESEQVYREKRLGQGRLYIPYPGADEKYDNGHKDWKLYNKNKYHDPNWSPDKE